MTAQTTKMQLSFCAVFAVVASVCVKFASPVDGQGYGNGHVGKKGTSSSVRYADYNRNSDPPLSCSMEADYEISQNYIIRTKDSKANGANFVAALSVRTFDVCLEQCCLKENCDTTIFVGEAYRSEETNCFLFVCRPEGKGGENRCLFTYHLGYISSMKKALGGFQGFAPDLVTTVRQIETTTKPTPPPKLAPIEPVSNCDSGYFECDSGQCINDLYVCNSVLDCDDGSDEIYRCSPQDPPAGDHTSPEEELQTNDEKLPPSLLIPPTNPPNMPKKYPDDNGQDGGGSVKGDTQQTLADQLNDQSPLENDDRGQSTIQDTEQEDRERELSNMKMRLQDESRLPQGGRNSKPDGDKNQDQFPELECHGASCYEINPDGGDTRFRDIQDEEQEDAEEGGGQRDEEENRKLIPQDRDPVDAPPRNLEREEYQTGDLRDDYQPPQRPKLPDYKEDVYDENTDRYRGADEVEDDKGYDLNDRINEENERREDREQVDRYEVNLDDRDASDQRDIDYDPIDRKMVSDHDMGMKHPADVESTRDDPYRDQDLGSQDHPPGDGTKDWRFPNNNKPPKTRPPTDEPPRRGISDSEPRLGPGYGYNSDYYSYYYPPYAQTKGRFKSQQTQNRPSDRYRQDSYSGRNSQDSSYNSNRYRGHGSKSDNTNRYDASDVYNNRRYHKVSDIPADQREEKFRSNDAKIRTGYNSLWNTWPYDYSSSVDDKVVVDDDLSLQNINRNGPSYRTSPKSRPNPKGHNGINAPAPPNFLPTSTITQPFVHLDVVTQAPDPIDMNVEQQEAVVTVMAPPQGAVTDGKAEDPGRVNDTHKPTEQNDENLDEMYESHGGSGMPPASSAILPLVIGLIITVVLLLMVGCRLRYMNQRLRYGRLKTSAHDADYLINGMYL